MRTMDFLARYRAGEREQVWAELVALGPAVREPALGAMSVAVAQAMMGRVRQNVEVLVTRLHTLGFREAFWQEPAAWLSGKIDVVEERYGVLPVVWRAWFDVVGQVDFTGAHPKLSHHSKTMVGPFSDPLQIENMQEDDYTTSFYTQPTRSDYDVTPPFSFDFASNPRTKAGYSGSNDSHFMIPCLGFDTPMFTDRTPYNGMFLIPYLRECFVWGGFPGLRDDPAAAEAAREELAFLTQGLLPI